MAPKRKLRQGEKESADEQVLPKKGKNDQVEDDDDNQKDINNEATYKEVLAHLYNQVDSEDRPLWEMFDELPLEEDFPVYYEFIKEPIDLKTIKKKIQTHQYSSINELEEDILLVFKNAHAFNEPKSQISKDATQMKKAYLAKRIELNKSLLAAKVGKRLKDREVRGSASEQSETEDSHGGEDEKPINEWPSTPTPVQQQQLQQQQQQLQQQQLQQQQQQQHRAPAPLLPPHPVLQSPPMLSSPMMSSPMAEEPPLSKKDDGLIDDTFDHNFLSYLYNMVTGFRDHNGKQISHPFLRLPVKRHNPGYFENLTKKPLSLIKIRTKIKANYYSDINILTKDISSVFENAAQYYEETSSLHKDALFLQRLLFEKKSEIEQSAGYLQMKDNLPKPEKRRNSRAPKAQEKRDSSEGGTPHRKVKQISTPDTPRLPDPKVQKDRLLLLYNTVLEYKDTEGRSLSTMFLELPDQEEYPEYYKVIPHPIDMEHIHEKIINGVYANETEFVHDFEILFQNARHFNEEGSEIYEDSVILEKALKKKRRYLNIADGKDQSPGGKGNQSSPSTCNRSHDLLHHIRSYADETGRVLSAIFERLPSRVDYPDYYILIKRPIDLMYIAQRTSKYSNIDEMEQDLLLLFNNACIYNEPDSQIYKDALTLLRIMTQKKAELCPEVAEGDALDVEKLVQDLLRKLFHGMMEHRDEEGRCYSDSLLEVMVDDVTTPTGEENEKRRKAINLPIVGQLLKLGFYRRLDVLQNDLFNILKEARRNAAADSEMFEDACELHTFFILERDVLTKEGVRMISPALNTTGKSVQQEIDYERKEKLQLACLNRESPDEETKKETKRKEAVTFEVTPEENLTHMDSVTHNDVLYQIGDFAYVKPEDSTRPHHIILIEKIWQQKDGLQGIYGNWYRRPGATFHLASRKFMERELFKSNTNSNIMLKGVVGKCFVMNVKDHSKFKPQGFKEEDIFVCESRYRETNRDMKKMKIIPPYPSHIKIVPRDVPLDIRRLPSPLTSPTQPDGKKIDAKTPMVGSQVSSIEGYEVPLEKSVEVDVPIPELGFSYYEKYSADNEVWKLGDCVYVKIEGEDYLLLSKIDKLWTDKSGTAYFRGNWFILPEDTKHMPTQFFMERECFESNIEENIPVTSIVGRCAILNQKDYQNSRPTEIAEKDVYICTARYNEEELKFRKNATNFRKLSVSEHIRDDEYWISEQPFPAKRRPSLWLTSVEDAEAEEEAEKQVDSEESGGFQLMKREYAAELMKEQPEISVDDIDSKTKEKWSSLPDPVKEELQTRAKKQGLGEEHLLVYQCCWSTCQYQFEDLQDLMIHVMEGPHLSILSPEGSSSVVYKCEWRNCERAQKDPKPFPTHSRLVRHIRGIHFKTKKTKILASEKSKFYFPRHQTCEEMFKENDRPSSRGSSASSLSPAGPMKMNRQQQPMSPAGGLMPNASSGGPMYPGAPMHMQAGMFPPYRMNGQPPPQSLMQQQIMQQQQIMMQRLNNPNMNPNPPPPMMNNPQQMMSNGPPPPGPPSSMMNNGPPGPPPPMMNSGPPMMNNPMGNQQQRPPHSNIPPPQQQQQQQQQQQHPQQGGPPLLSLEKQQVLITQVQRQQQQIQKLQQQVQQLVVQQQQQKAEQEKREQETPVFVAPPPNNLKLRHSEAYLRYIEGLRDNSSSLSSWTEVADQPHPKNPNPLPTEWLGDTDHGFDSAVDALWALRDHMLRDSVSISKIL